MKIGMQCLQMAKTLYNVDDTTNKDGKITHYLVLNVQTWGKVKRMTFLVAEIGKEDVILGYPWLSAYEPQFDWAKGTLNGEYHPVILSSTVPDDQLPTIGALQLEDKEKILNELESECQGRSIATDLARFKAEEKEVPTIPKEYQDFASVFSEEEAELFPPSRPWDHAIDLKPNTPDQINCQVYPMTPLEDQALDDFIDEQLAKGYIRPSISPYASSFFFIKKKDDKLRPVQDYRTINKWTVRNQYPLPLIPTLIYDLGGAHIYTKLDVRWGYNNVRIKKGDEWKAAFKTRRGLYEPTVMFFGLTNSPATFQAMMNHIYRNTIIKHEALGTIIRVYMDDIAIVTKTPLLAAHTNAVRDILHVAKEQSLYFKLSKCTFHATSIDSLGVILEKGVTRMDLVKVAGIQTWPTPKSVREVRSFHGFCNFYRPFIAGFAKIALPLNKLTKKDTPFVWTPECQKAFETLKHRVTSEPVLAHPDLTKQFELEVDASGYAVGAVLLQRQVDNKRHPIGYYSATLTSAERNYDIYDLELLAIVKALRNWRPFLAGSPHKVKIFSDHMNLQYWRDPRKISRRVAREVLELANYDYEIHHLKGKSNGRADALSRRPDYDQGERDNENITVLPKRVWAQQTSAGTEGQDEDTIRRWIDPHHLKQIGGRWEKAGRKVITGDEEERRRLVRNHHDPPAYGHPGIQKTADLVQRHYWWPTLKKDVVQFVKGCGECQQNKVNTRPEKAALSPIFPKPDAKPFEVIALDFITKLPKSHHYNSILTITDHDCTKASLFIPCREEITAEEVTHLFIAKVFKNYGLPSKVISDQDPRFTSKFMRELCQILGIQQDISTAYHPRTDGQSERTNQWVETYLRFFVNYQQDDWAQYLPLAEFAHNNWKNTTTGESPFYLLMGSHPRADWEDADSPMPQVTTRLEQITEARRRAQEAMIRAQNLWIKHENTAKYQVGDQVWLDGRNLQIDRPTAKLAARRHGPFKIEKVLSPLSYQLTLPHQWRIHPVFHTDLLTPYKETEFHGRNYTYPPPDLIEGEEQYEVEHVLDSRIFGQRKTKQYLVKWKGYPHSDNQWVSKKDMNANEAIKEYEQDKSRSRRGDALHQPPMSRSPISVESSPSSSEHVNLIDVNGHTSEDVAEARRSFPTPR